MLYQGEKVQIVLRKLTDFTHSRVPMDTVLEVTESGNQGSSAMRTLFPTRAPKREGVNADTHATIPRRSSMPRAEVRYGWAQDTRGSTRHRHDTRGSHIASLAALPWYPQAIGRRTRQSSLIAPPQSRSSEACSCHSPAAR